MAITRLESHVFPLEDRHSQETYEEPTHLNKLVVFKGEYPGNKRQIHLILVEEDLGF